MQALVLERKGELSLREIDLPGEIGPDDVRIAIHTVGICGSDVHYYEYSGAGPIGIVTALAALDGGCSQIVITDVQQPNLDLAAGLGPIRPVNVAKESLRAVIDELTEGWGADIVFEASGAPAAIESVHEPLCPSDAKITRPPWGARLESRVPLEPALHNSNIESADV